MVIAARGTEAEHAPELVGQRGGHSEQEPASLLVWRALEWARLGDRGAAGFLYTRFSDDVHACALAIFEDHVRADEATRRVFASLGESVEWLPRDVVSPRAWLLACTRTLAARDSAG